MTTSTHPSAPPTPEVVADDELIARWIEPDPHYPTRERAWLRDHSVSVASVVLRWQSLAGDVEAVARALRVPTEAVAAALAYYRRNKEFIDARLTLERAWWVEDSGAIGSPEEEELIARWIEPDPHDRMPDHAWIVDHSVSVLAVVLRWQASEDDIEVVARALRVPVAAAEAALAFYRCHQPVFDARITLDTRSFPE
jgi:uncharacterized protein (DUF433 family)